MNLEQVNDHLEGKTIMLTIDFIRPTIKHKMIKRREKNASQRKILLKIDTIRRQNL